jgi:mono/diheme cytochrome c family protein
MRAAPVIAAMLMAAGVVPALQQRIQAPLSPHTAHAAVGVSLYREHCETCHGADGRGGGPSAAAMHFMPPDLTMLAAGNHDVFPSERVRQIIEGRGPAVHGDRLMPIWGDVFTRTARGRDSAKLRVDELVRYLESIQRRPA